MHVTHSSQGRRTKREEEGGRKGERVRERESVCVRERGGRLGLGLGKG